MTRSDSREMAILGTGFIGTVNAQSDRIAGISIGAAAASVPGPSGPSSSVEAAGQMEVP